MKVRYTRQAVGDLIAIAGYIREHNPSAAIMVERAVHSTIDMLADFPQIGRDRPELNARALSIPRFPYTAYYRIEGNDIWIVHIRDDRREPLKQGDL